jgi:hypothetical protein
MIRTRYIAKIVVATSIAIFAFTFQAAYVIAQTGTAPPALLGNGGTPQAGVNPAPGNRIPIRLPRVLLDLQRTPIQRAFPRLKKSPQHRHLRNRPSRYETSYRFSMMVG